jgi:hypothetical protein
MCSVGPQRSAKSQERPRGQIANDPRDSPERYPNHKSNHCTVVPFAGLAQIIGGDEVSNNRPDRDQHQGCQSPPRRSFQRVIAHTGILARDAKGSVDGQSRDLHPLGRLVVYAGSMHLLGISWDWSIATESSGVGSSGAGSSAVESFAVAGLCAFALMAVIGLVESRGNVGECLRVWRFAFFKGFEWLAQKLLGPRPDARVTAEQLSDVLQMPMIDAELSLELSRAFFDPTGDASLNNEAVALLSAPTPRNETWRARARACCERLTSHY